MRAIPLPPEVVAALRNLIPLHAPAGAYGFTNAQTHGPAGAVAVTIVPTPNAVALLRSRDPRCANRCAVRAPPHTPSAVAHLADLPS